LNEKFNKSFTNSIHEIPGGIKRTALITFEIEMGGGILFC
jgi:hypothetical protein